MTSKTKLAAQCDFQKENMLCMGFLYECKAVLCLIKAFASLPGGGEVTEERRCVNSLCLQVNELRVIVVCHPPF